MVKILGVKIDNLTMDEAVSKLKDLHKKENPTMVFTPNSEILYLASKDTEFKNILNSADLCTADGIGVVYASKILKNPISQRVSGFDLACNILSYMNEFKLKLILFGGAEGVAKKAKENILLKYPDIRIEETINGYFDSSEEIIKTINKHNADFVFVCLGAPKQEKWIYENKDKLNCKVMMAIGGSIDVFAGAAKRAPEIFIKLNLEWLYRIVKNPSRYKRALNLPKFVLAVLKTRKENKNA